MTLSCDVLVIGGGISGTFAAISAAREGANTILVEKEEYLGGTGYAGMLQHICGLYLNADSVPAETLNGGMVREFVNGLQQKEKQGVQKIGQVYVLPYDPEDLLSLLLSLCEKENRLELLRGHNAAAVNAGEGIVHSITVAGPNVDLTIVPAVVIDCSGDAVVAAMAGADFELSSPEERQLAGFTVRLDNLKNVNETLSIKVPYHLRVGVERGLLPDTLRFTTFTPAELFAQGYCKINVQSEAVPSDREAAKKLVETMLQYLADAIPEFKDARIIDTALKFCEREGKRIVGEYTLTAEDVLEGRKFSDAVAKNAWPIELWDSRKGTVYKYLPRGEYYEIPFRCLKPKGFTNLLSAGRCISVTHEALGSTRVMGACMALGEQAGKAAVHKVKYGKYS